MKRAKPGLASACGCSLLLLSFALCAGCKSQKADDDASAASSAEPLTSAEHKGKRGLPPAMFDACQGKGAGDACTVQFGSKSIEAKCAAMTDGRLACRPERHEHKRPEGS